MTTLHPLGHRPVAIVGTGRLARSIGLVLASRGGVVRIWGRRRVGAEEARAEIERRLPDLVAIRGGEAAVGSIEVHDDLATALAGAGLVVETVAEDPALKRTLLAELDGLADPGAIVASNSSSIPVASYADALRSPERVLNVHFHNPPVHNAVDLLSSGWTRPEIIEHLLVELPRFGLVPFVSTKPDQPFPFNRMMDGWFREALQIVADDASSIEDVDGIWMVDTGMPIGPFELMDQIGLDVIATVERRRRQDNPALEGWQAVELLERYIDAGRLGLKTGEGFYRWGPDGERRGVAPRA